MAALIVVALEPKFCNLGMVDVNINIVRTSSGYSEDSYSTAALLADGSWYTKIENCFVTGQISSNVGGDFWNLYF